MKERFFSETHKSEWEQSEKQLELAEKNRDKLWIKQLPQTLQRLSHQLSLARHRAYSKDTRARIEHLIEQIYPVLYAPAQKRNIPGLREFFIDFPREVRANSSALGLATLLFLGTALLTAFAVYLDPGAIYTILGESQVHHIEQMYDPANKALGQFRNADSDFMMFGMYIWNNIGIAFKTFALGILLGFGTGWILFYNGLVLGAIFVHMWKIGYIETFYGFVATHSAPELTAIVLSGQAGFMIGKAILFPGEFTRGSAIAKAAQKSMRIMGGATVFLVIAAFIEAYWSSRAGIPSQSKYFSGLLSWLLVFMLLFKRR
ncbi:MAG: stage II sporulation protein M [bacterium]